MLQPKINLPTVPLRGGAITVREKALLPFGAFSMVQNLRCKYPGFEKRKGCRKKATTADGDPVNKVLSLYQFSKGKHVERYFFAQMSDGDVLQATDAPPTVTTGEFGSEAHDGTTDQIPGSWSNLNDICIYSNGKDQHQLFAGSVSATTGNYVEKFVKYDAAATPPSIPSDGYDYTKEVTDGLTTTCAILDGLKAFASHECLFICTPIPANQFYWTIGKVNSTVATGTLRYRKNDNSWEDTEETDNTAKTINGGDATLGQSGSMTWTHPTDEIPSYMFGISGFWYRWETGTTLDAEVEITSLTYGSAFQNLRNVWCGIPEYAIEARFYDDSASTYATANTPRSLPIQISQIPAQAAMKPAIGGGEFSGFRVYSTDTIEIDDMTTADGVFFNSFYPIQAFYVDPGDCMNTSASTTINKVYQWTGAGWTQIASITDETDGISHGGWVTLNMTAAERAAAQPTQFQNAKYYSYWYYFTVDTTLSDNVLISIETMPYFDIADFGISQCNAIWKNRAVYTFDRYPNYIYISAQGRPMVLNGPDSAILRAGDGRANKIACMLPFYNELLAWQRETGKEGGTLTLFQGTDASDFRPVVLSSSIGTFSAKSACVVEDVIDNFNPTEGVKQEPKTFAFFLSRQGVFTSDGISVFRISGAIQNYFDPKESECIRRGYENEHWICYDSTDKVLKLGLVSGSSATVPNVFPVLDLQDKVWYFDNHAQPLACMTEVEGASGDQIVLQYGGGTADGFVYQLNYGTNDVTTLIDSYLTMEFNGMGEYLVLKELVALMKVQTAGNMSLTITKNGIAAVSAKSLSMTAEITNQIIRRHRVKLDVVDQHLSIKLQHNTASQTMYLEQVGLNIDTWEKR